MIECALVLFIAFVLDAVLGDPVCSLHPVRLVGQAVSRIERGLRCLNLSGIVGGGILAITTLSLFLGGYLGLRFLAGSVHHGLAMGLDVIILYSSITIRDMLDHAGPVAAALDGNDLDGARESLQKIVGRDTAILDRFGTARAAIESVSEGFVDGFFSPLCWYVFGGVGAFLLGKSCLATAVSLAFACRIINTLDSMVGYRSERYLRFGRVSARLDDAMNFIPARLSVPALFLAGIVCQLNAIRGLRTAVRDRLKHSSPNAGHPESFAAGAMGLKLGGPVSYPHGTVDRPWIGDGTPDASSKQILTACRLTLCAGWISLTVSLAILISGRILLDKTFREGLEYRKFSILEHGESPWRSRRCNRGPRTAERFGDMYSLRVPRISGIYGHYRVHPGGKAAVRGSIREPEDLLKRKTFYGSPMVKGPGESTDLSEPFLFLCGGL